MSPRYWHEGDVVRKLRLRVQWTLEDLSRASGLTIQVINRLEQGKTADPKTKTLDKLAQAFHPEWTANYLRAAVPQGLELEPQPALQKPAARAPPETLKFAIPRSAVRKRRRA